MKKVLFGLAMVAWLSGVMPASGHVVEVTTSLDAAEAQDPVNFKQALRTAVDKILSETVAFQPTLVALTHAQLVGERVYVRILLADGDGEQMLNDVPRGPGGPSRDDPTSDRDEMRI
jgi:hypothetical protein